MLDDSIEIEVEIRDTYYYDSVLDNVNGECAVIKETHESFENLLRESVLENEATQKKRDAAKRFGFRTICNMLLRWQMATSSKRDQLSIGFQ